MERVLLITFFLVLSSCADVTRPGKKVHFVESDKGAADWQDKADFLEAKHDCQYIGFADAKTSYFPPSYSQQENEVHAALRNRAAKMGGNLVISNFYQKPAQGIVMSCPQEYFKVEL